MQDKKQNLGQINDMAIMLKYLCASEKHYVECDAGRLMMDKSLNLILEPHKNDKKGERKVSKMDYSSLMEVAKQARRNRKIDDMKIAVMYSEI